MIHEGKTRDIIHDLGFGIIIASKNADDQLIKKGDLRYVS